MDITESLSNLQLSPREAKIYRGLLELGVATPLQLSKKTGLKRPTTYLDLESLRRKKLAGLTFRGKKMVYAPEPPEKLLQSIDDQRRVALKLLPLLKAIENKDGKKTQIRYYESQEEINELWKRETYQAPENWYISDFSKIYNVFPEVNEEYLKVLLNGPVKRSNEIYFHNADNVQLAKNNKEKNRHIRIMPKGFNFDIDICIWEDSVALYSIVNHYMLVIQDASIAQSFKTIFAFIWLASQGAKDVEKPKSGH